MAPKVTTAYSLSTLSLPEPGDEQSISKSTSRPATTTAQPQEQVYELSIVWRNVIAFIILHSFSVCGFYLMFNAALWKTIIFSFLVANVAGIGITAGAHRLWAHRAYKATLPLRVFLMICQTIAFQNHIFEWVRDHRVHHKFTDTDADPHNSKRGFFFSHIGWLMVRKHPEVRAKGELLDMSDLLADPVVMWQKTYYVPLMVTSCFIVPTLIPVIFWNEQLDVAFLLTIARYTFQLNATWLVNSAAHIWGMKPYDKKISSTQNKGVAILSLGEGWHNYHHVFPWDYKSAEMGNYGTNFTVAFIDACAYLGLAYDLKSVSHEQVVRRALRTGDGSRDSAHHQPGTWGWGDSDVTEEDLSSVRITYRKTTSISSQEP